jgi:hypothetical protein
MENININLLEMMVSITLLKFIQQNSSLNLQHESVFRKCKIKNQAVATKLSKEDPIYTQYHHQIYETLMVMSHFQLRR